MTQARLLGPLVSGLLFATLATSAHAECSGGLGRGWASGKGAGKFEMTAADKKCPIGFAYFIDDKAGTRTPATDIALTRAPQNGKIGIAKTGVVYTPTPGFKGQDKFCTSNTTKEVPGKKLSGCVAVTVR